MSRTAKKPKIKVGDVYQDCAYHPVWCTESDSESLAGISLFDGSGPRGCSVRYCETRKMTAEQVAIRIKNRDRWLAALEAFRNDWSNQHLIEALLKEELPS